MRGWLMMAALPLAACSVSVDAAGNDGVTGTGGGNARDFAVSDFSGVKLAGPDDVDIRIGKAFSVHATGPAQTLDRLRIVKEGDTLSVGRKNTIGFGWGGGRPAHIVVTMPAIRAAAITGSGGMTVDRVTGDSFKAAATGSGALRLAAVDVKQADFSITGSGNIAAAGRAASLDVGVTGSGDLSARSLVASRAKVSVTGSGQVTATVNGSADVSILGSGDVDLGPNAHCRNSKTGSGTVSCGK